MHAGTFGLFALTELTLCLTPGPAVLLVLSQALTRGALRSIWSTSGILAGNLFYFVLSATSVVTVLMTSYELFLAIKWAGAAYLVGLGLSILFSRSSAFAVAPVRDDPAKNGRLFLQGLLLQLANPKAILFFTALVPQFIDPAAPAAGQVTIMATTSFAIELAVLSVYGALAGRATAYAAQRRFAMLTNRLAGSMLVIAGIGMASVRRG